MSENYRIRIPLRAALTLLRSYAWQRLAEQARAVSFIVLYLGAFQILVLEKAPAGALRVAGGIGLVILGLALFLEGLILGLMPIGERVGLKLPQRTGLVVIVGFGFLLGVGSTFAEPAVAALRIMGGNLNAWEAPLLFHMIEQHSWGLVSAVGLGVGFAVAAGMLRLYFGLSIKLFIFTLIPLLLAVSLYCAFHGNLAAVLGLAWDTGAVTTGAVTVPLVLALGIGVSRAIGKQKESAGGFGMIMLASTFPVLSVLVLGIATDAGLPRAMGEEEFFAAGNRPATRALFSTDEELMRHAYQRGNEAGRRAFHGTMETHRDAVRALADPATHAATLGDLTLSVWLRDRASDWERALVERPRQEPLNTAGFQGATFRTVFREEFLAAMQSVVPLAALLLVVLFLLLRDRMAHHDEIVLGLIMSLVGMAVLTSGIRTGLAPMGNEAGRGLPRIFRYDPATAERLVLEPFDPARDVFTVYGRDGQGVLHFHLRDERGVLRSERFDPALYDEESGRYEHVIVRHPLFSKRLTVAGVGLVLLFAFGLGYGSTLAEPALSALGRKVEEITVGTVKKTGVVRAVSVGVGLGLVAGMARIVYDLPTIWLIMPPYVLLLALTPWSEEEFTGMAWDCGGVTTGVVTVPLVMAMGLSVGGELQVVDGFGVLALASVYPILTVLLYGVALRIRQRRSIRSAEGNGHA